jgi:hypothetical protein
MNLTLPLLVADVCRRRRWVNRYSAARIAASSVVASAQALRITSTARRPNSRVVGDAWQASMTMPDGHLSTSCLRPALPRLRTPPIAAQFADFNRLNVAPDAER